MLFKQLNSLHVFAMLFKVCSYLADPVNGTWRYVPDDFQNF